MNKHRESKNTPPHEDSSRGSKLSIILSLILYAIPLIFFIICYFLIITSGEDIYQGANTTPDIIGDSIAAFNYNARLSDMYAWSVINFFDYKYSFGIDTIFRLLDVAMGMGIIYLMTYFALGHKPRLKISDATWFLFCFVMIFLTPHGRTLYAGFSVIHNYLIITLSALIFLIPFIRLIRGQDIPDKTWFIITMLSAGFVFGFSSNLTPIAFLITFALAKIYFSVKRKKLELAKWEIMGIVGIVIGIAIQYLLGPGVTSYINGDYSITYDYVSLDQILSDIPHSSIRIIRHIVSNYGRVLLPLLLVFATYFTIYIIIRRKTKQEIKVLPINEADRRTLHIGLLFLVVHIAIASQIDFPLRIILPAYIVGIVCLTILLKYMLSQLDNRTEKAFVFCLLLTSLCITTLRLILAVSYLQKVEPTLDIISNSTDQSLCVPKESIASTTIPIIYLGQEPILADWAMPETIYGKTITFCD